MKSTPTQKTLWRRLCLFPSIPRSTHSSLLSSPSTSSSPLLLLIHPHIPSLSFSNPLLSPLPNLPSSALLPFSPSLLCVPRLNLYSLLPYIPSSPSIFHPSLPSPVFYLHRITGMNAYYIDLCHIQYINCRAKSRLVNIFSDSHPLFFSQKFVLRTYFFIMYISFIN